MEPAQDSAEISDALKIVCAKMEESLGDKLLASSVFRGELTFLVPAERWAEAAVFCRDTPGLQFERLDCLVANHFPERTDRPFEVVAHLTSISNVTRLRLKTQLAEREQIATLTDVWPSAGWDEREAWEMYGIEFAGHPDLRRLLTTEDFEGFPLRKDFPLRGTMGGRIRTNLKGKI